ncbi:MAG: hypothetical protein ACPGJS_05985 [Flammeovirgaceae bacterium]
MKNLILLLILTLTISCKANELVKVKFVRVKSARYCIMKVPKGFEFHRSSGSRETEFMYLYSDSSILYITSFTNTENYKNIRDQGSYYQKLDAHYADSTLFLQGVDSLGLYWKDITFGELSIGYKNVAESQKALFDSALNSVKYK